MPVVCLPRAIDYAVPQEDERFKKFIFNWMNLHVTDHNSFFLALNGLRKSLNLPLLKFHRFQLFFDPEKLGLVNNFIFFNAIEHKEIYKNINELGQRATPIFYVTPVYNMVKNFQDLQFKTFGEFLFHENRVHTLTSRAINLLYDAL